MHLSICNLNIPLGGGGGTPRAFDTLPFPGSREFGFRTAEGGKYTTSEEKMLNYLADKVLRSWPNGEPKTQGRFSTKYEVPLSNYFNVKANWYL